MEKNFDETDKIIYANKWVMYNSKLLSFGGFETDVGMKPDEFQALYPQECKEAWLDYVRVIQKEASEATKQAQKEKKERIQAFRLEQRKSKPKSSPVPIAIKQLAEMHVMVALGEFTAENFLKAFHARFSGEILKVKNRRRKESNYGWDAIDWERVESHPLLSQLLD